MGQEQGPVAGPLDTQARLDHQRHWATVLDSVLASAVVVWLMVVTFADPDPRLRWVVPLVLGVVVVHRVLVLVEGSYPTRRADTVAPSASPVPTPTEVARAA